MTEVFGGKSVYVSGRFPGLSKDEVWTYLLGLGAIGTTSKSTAQAYLCPDRSDAKLVATGKPIYTLEDLGAPLAGYVDRVGAAVAARREEYKRDKNLVTHFAHGAPADDALIARVEAALGFPAPAELKTLMRQFNGLSAVAAKLKRGAELTLPSDAPLPYAALADMNHPLWRGGKVEWLMGVIAIPTWEEVFLRPQAQRICDPGGAYGPKDVIKIGGLKVAAGQLFPRLFAFDLYHSFGGTALYADPKDQTVKAIYAFDAWADITSAQPVSLRAYMESLAAGLWGRVVHAGQRWIQPVSKTAWPTYIRNIHGAPYVFVELK